MKLFEIIIRDVLCDALYQFVVNFCTAFRSLSLQQKFSDFPLNEFDCLALF